MAYRISLAVFQTNPDRYFSVVEQTAYVRSSWGIENGRYVFTMSTSGNSGTIRFLSDNGESFLFVVGVHSGVRWCDIVPDLQDDQTGTVIHPEYYTGDRAEQREKQLASYQITNATGRLLTINFTQADSENLAANIIIG